MKKQQIYTLVIIFIIVGLLASIVFSANNNEKTKPDSSDIGSETKKDSEVDAVIYYGIQCPFCKDVDQWLEDNQVEEFLTIEHKEVSQNLVNSAELQKVAIKCGFKQNAIGVPFMVVDGQCYSGKIEIIDYLQEQLELKKGINDESLLEESQETQESKEMQEVGEGGELKKLEINQDKTFNE